MVETTDITVIETEQGNVSLDKNIVKGEIALSEEAVLIARSMMVKDEDSYIVCSDEWKRNKQALKDTEEMLQVKIKPFMEIVKIFRMFYAIPKSNYEKAIEIEGSVMQNYNARMKAMADAENAKLKAIADKKSRELEERAKKAAEAGNAAKAEKLREEAALKATLVPQVQANTIKTAGQREGTEYYAKVEDKDKKTFIEWCLKTENLHYLDTSEKELKITARSAKGTRVIPGVTFWSDTKMKGSR